MLISQMKDTQACGSRYNRHDFLKYTQSQFPYIADAAQVELLESARYGIQIQSSHVLRRMIVQVTVFPALCWPCTD